ncbi:hypothetical protein BO94DRAFT_530534 [Aspergillus sclerotioniger CBS 115572]|uniref:Uncharacterized protein n=1 Tax=Aspergillus sclerotioniger CBS 115572 TaxID=1450535 RepID=A0A317XDJ5_9EURO|nr:hypothetical protein BO94DRAFT_530534 [Aspergillus sclerotioniger CBS 115572]PWY95802.1 hypothetical protein BO94DRAFT_530534 [Aspergillus sclerotioniger CBS 115572]
MHGNAAGCISLAVPWGYPRPPGNGFNPGVMDRFFKATTLPCPSWESRVESRILHGILDDQGIGCIHACGGVWEVIQVGAGCSAKP